MMNGIQLQPARIDQVCIKQSQTIDVLRLDLIHPVISGNKWYKLKGYLKEARQLGKKTILTFGGAYSNHIIATAAAASSFEMKSAGIIRGERMPDLSHTLKAAESYGMQLFFVSRDAYKTKSLPAALHSFFREDELYMISEGGYGITGAIGAGEILSEIEHASYTHIIAAVGTGTMLAGLVRSAAPECTVIGISVMKNNQALKDDINLLLPENRQDHFQLIHDYHFGGYAKFKAPLLEFMNEWYRTSLIPTDFVYTGKLFYAIKCMAENNDFPNDARILVIHSGGLQGNRSLPNGTLIF